MQSDNRILTQTEAAELLGISSVTLWRERKAGRISFRRIASKVVFTSEDISEYLERHKTKAVELGSKVRS